MTERWLERFSSIWKASPRKMSFFNWVLGLTPPPPMTPQSILKIIYTLQMRELKQSNMLKTEFGNHFGVNDNVNQMYHQHPLTLQLVGCNKTRHWRHWYSWWNNLHQGWGPCSWSHNYVYREGFSCALITQSRYFSRCAYRLIINSFKLIMNKHYFF